MATARLRPQMMRLTDAAADRIKSVITNAGRPIVGVRVGVKNGGCAGMAYTMEYAEKVEPSDEVVEDKGVRVRGRSFLDHFLGVPGHVIANFECVRQGAISQSSHKVL